MSTSVILLDQNFNANDVDILVFEPSVLFPQFGGKKMLCSQIYMYTQKMQNFSEFSRNLEVKILRSSPRKTLGFKHKLK